MILIINGETKVFQEEICLLEIIDSLNIKDKVMACSINMNIVKKELWDTYRLKNDDKIELLQFVGGG